MELANSHASATLAPPIPHIDMPLGDRLETKVSADAIDDVIAWWWVNNPPFHWLELAWDTRRLYGDEAGFKIFCDLADTWDPPDLTVQPNCLVDAWAAVADLPLSQYDRLWIDAMGSALDDGWDGHPDTVPFFDELDSEVDATLSAWNARQNEYWRQVAAGIIPAMPTRLPEGTPMPSNITPFPLPSNPESAPAKLRSRRIDATSLAGKDIPLREWCVPGLVPAGNVTLLYGDGGTGKSLLALQLAVAKVTGSEFFTRPLKPGAVEFVTAEDSIDEMHRRLSDIARSTGTPLASLTGLHLTSLADEDAILAAPEDGRGGALAATTLYAELDSVLGDAQPSLLVLDTLADVYGGNEIVRSQVRQFVGMLRKLCLQHGVTILVLAHPSLAGMDKGTSGSTGWNNSVRSRLYLTRMHDSDGSEANEDARVLRVGKSNYGRVGAEIEVRWQNGVFVAAAATPAGDPIIQRAKAEKLFLLLLGKYTAQDRPVSLSNGANFAPKLFESEARAQGFGKRAMKDAMSRLLDDGRIRNVSYGPPSRTYRRLESTDNSASQVPPLPT